MGLTRGEGLAIAALGVVAIAVGSPLAGVLTILLAAALTDWT